MESLKPCLTLPEKWFCIRRPDLALQSFQAILYGSEDSIQAFDRLQNKFIGNFNVERALVKGFKGLRRLSRKMLLHSLTKFAVF